MSEIERRIELERLDAAQKALSAVLTEIDRLAGNDLYQRAWKKVAIKVNELKRRESF